MEQHPGFPLLLTTSQEHPDRTRSVYAGNIERLTQTPETPATTQDEVPSEEHRDAAHSTLPYGGVAPDPACLEGNTACYSDQNSGQYPRVIQVFPVSSWVMEL
ncbi:hypothetical protein P7K49_011725 [Saguinus oedipus]|uniref:Uncharacterized protein n=1 Tax=Saguinus oedipus TaxID=9490 RepID=A0ABQ9VRG7_SAGOE|nr:hypothetical protein P7K49_011725 [Saguinus oedipus]